ncbi:response regulator [bacterium]|nr:response regulator [bacterium]
MVRLVIYLVLSISVLSACQSRSIPSAHNGIMDLSEWDFEENGTIRLDGEWLFYWNQIRPPDSFISSESRDANELIKLPGAWNEISKSGDFYSEDGYCTMLLNVKIKPGSKELAVHILDIHSTYSLWINNELVAMNGTVAKQLKDEQFLFYNLQLASFQPQKDQLQIVLQVSNFHHHKAGVTDSIVLGDAGLMKKAKEQNYHYKQFINGILLGLGMFFLLLYLNRKHDYSFLFLAVYCFLWVINFQCPWLSERHQAAAHLLKHVEFISYYFTIPTLIAFLAVMFPDESIPLVKKGYVLLSVVFSVLAVFSNLKSLGIQFDIYLILTVPSMIYGVYVITLAAIKKRPDSMLILIGLLLLISTGAIDIVLSLQNKSLNMVTIYGLLLFIATMSISISKRFSRAFSEVNRLSLELTKKNAALSKLDKLKDEFLVNTTHELKTPLHGMIGIADSVIEVTKGKLDLQLLQNLELITKSGRRLSNLIDDILDYSQLRQHDLILDLKPVHLQSNVSTVISIVSQLLKGKPIHLINKVSEDFPLVLADVNRLQQILYNLIGNAVKYTDEGEITIEGKLLDSNVEIIISDTGVGIPADRFTDIFNSFEQLDGGTNSSRGGTGIGLYITKQLVELHGSEIQVESEVGAGSIFRFQLKQALISEIRSERSTMPVSIIENQMPESNLLLGFTPLANKNKATKERSTDESDVTVLVIDDELINLTVISNYLSSADINVESISDTRKVMSYFDSNPVPDLILLDVMMPHISGYELCEKIRRDFNINELPIIMLTVKNRVEDLKLGFKVGANDYITKPFTKDELLSRSISCIKTKQGYRALKENLILRNELNSRKETEEELKKTHYLMLEMLNNIDASILAFNESEEISFYNDSFKSQTGYLRSDEWLLGKPLGQLVTRKSIEQLLRWKHQLLQRNSKKTKIRLNITFIKSDNSKRKQDIICQVLDLEEEKQFIMIFDNTENSNKNEDLSVSATAMIEELNKNKERLQKIEDSISIKDDLKILSSFPIVSEIQTIKDSIKVINTTLTKDQEKDEKRKLTVEIMNLSIDYWQQITGTTKADLAGKSKIWNVYTDSNGWERTQTLDKYLTVKTLPQYPHWKKIIKTADYVLNELIEKTSKREALLTALTKLNLMI